MRGVGYLTPLLDLSQEQRHLYWTTEFLVEAKVEYNPFLQGHPQMVRYKRWVDTICDELQEKLDVQKQGQRAKETVALDIQKRSLR